MTRPDSPSWIRAKTAGDVAELAFAEWMHERGFDVHKSVGNADHDLRITADVEVKRDMKHEKTGNVAIEVSYNGQPSGIRTSRAAYWIIVLARESLMMKRKQLFQLVEGGEFPEVSAGDGRKTRVRLVPSDRLKELPGTRIISQTVVSDGAA